MVSFWVLSGSGLSVPGIQKLSCIVFRFNRTFNLSSNPEGLKEISFYSELLKFMHKFLLSTRNMK